MDRSYRTLPERAHRAISGKSSGGYGAMVQSMRHPEVFGAVANHSGDIYFEFGLLPDLAKLHANLLKLGGVEAFIAQIATYKPKTPRSVLLGPRHALLRRGLRAEPRGAARFRHADRHGDGGAPRGCLGALAGVGPGPDDRPAGLSRGLAVDALHLHGLRALGRAQLSGGDSGPVAQAEGGGDRPRFRALSRTGISMCSTATMSACRDWHERLEQSRSFPTCEECVARGFSAHWAFASEKVLAAQVGGWLLGTFCLRRCQGEH